MKLKTVLLSIVMSVLFLNLFAGKVTEPLAQLVATNFANVQQMAGETDAQLALVATKTMQLQGEETTCFYFFNVINGTGFVIVTADDVFMPIIGWSDQCGWNPENVPPQLTEFLNGFTAEFVQGLQRGVTATAEISQLWDSYIEGRGLVRTVAAVTPLLSTTWDQSPYYNQNCPNGSVTGCVATSMAQVMKHYGHPNVTQTTTIPGYTTYSNTWTIPSITSSRSYTWSNMPPALSASSSTVQKDAVATLMYHCGVSVEMDYDPSGSASSTNDVPYAMFTYFDYDGSIQIYSKANYTEATWIAMLKADLDASQPIIYRGSGNAGGHAWVCDGYTANNYFHMNWGWGGAYNGDFLVSSLNPSTYTFNTGCGAVLGIKPNANGSHSYILGTVYTSSSASVSSIEQGEGFFAFTGYYNNGAWDIPANTSFGFVFVNIADQVMGVARDVVRSSPLQSGYYFYNDNGFSCTVPSTLAAGNYTLKAAMKLPGSSTWILALPEEGFTNAWPITVTTETPSVTTTTLPNATVGVAYNQTLAALGGTPITWSLDVGSLPAGLSLSTTGVISGMPSAAGTFNFTVKATNSAGNNTKALSIIVNKGSQTIIFQTPTPTSQTYSPTFNYTNTASGGSGIGAITYAKTAGTASVTVNATSGAITNVSAVGTVTITATKASDVNYHEATATYTVTIVKANQTISWNQLLTATVGDAPITLTATASSGLGVSYTSGDPTVATVGGNTLTILSEGSSIITATQAGNDLYNAASNVQNTVTVATAPVPIVANFMATITQIMEGDSVLFNDLSSGDPTSWSWTFQGGIPSVSTEVNPVITYNNAGSYDVSLVVSNASGSDTKTVTQYIQVRPFVGISTPKTSKISVYPNPSSDYIMITGVSPQLIADRQYNETITILDMNGRVMRTPLISSQNEIIKIDISQLAQGVYVVKIGDKTAKLVKN